MCTERKDIDKLCSWSMIVASSNPLCPHPKIYKILSFLFGLWLNVVKCVFPNLSPGEFATQTCFQGRFGEELGSDEFGGQIMVHQVDKDTQVGYV